MISKTFLFKAQLPLLMASLFTLVPSAQAALVMGSETTNVGGVDVSAGSNAINSLTVPGSTTYGNTVSPGLTNLVAPPSDVANYNFYDDYIFSVGTGAVDSITSTINLSTFLDISNLEVRLYSGSTPTLSPTGSVIDAWSGPITYAPGLTGTVAVLPTTTLSAGDYVFEVRGVADGSAGGSYSGVLNVAAVPLPSAVWLLGSALAGLGFLRRRRS